MFIFCDVSFASMSMWFSSILFLMVLGCYVSHIIDVPILLKLGKNVSNIKCLNYLLKEFHSMCCFFLVKVIISVNCPLFGFYETFEPLKLLENATVVILVILIHHTIIYMSPAVNDHFSNFPCLALQPKLDCILYPPVHKASTCNSI